MSGSPRESSTTNTILRNLRARGAYATKNHGGSYARAGTPDITACYQGRCILIEVKTTTGRVTTLQTIELDKARRAGAHTIIARSWSDVEHVLDQIQLDSWGDHEQNATHDPRHRERRAIRRDDLRRELGD